MGTLSRAALVAGFWLLISGAAHATVPLVDPAIGHAIDAALTVAGRSNLAKSMKPVSDILALARVKIAVALVRSQGGHTFRYRKTRVVLVAGTPGEPNAFCTGPSIYVARELVKTLNDRQLTAVLAHEMGHAERGHVTSRMTFGLSAALLQFGRLVKSDVHSLSQGQADAYMRELQAKGHWKMIQEMLEAGTLGQEMQADCLAFGWLETMHARGLENRGDDLADAVVNVLGLSEKMLADDGFMGARLRAVRAGVYADGRCD